MKNCFAEETKGGSEKSSRCIDSRKSSQEPVRSHEGKALKGCSGDETVTEKLSEFLVSVFTAEDVGESLVHTRNSLYQRGQKAGY